jgi:capsular exopolysaccharide synthesis family protein
VAQVLLERVNSGQVGVPGLKLTEIDTPSVPESSFYPNTKLTYAVAVLVGLGLGIATAFLWETLGRRVRTRSDLADAAGVPVFAEIALTPAVRSVHSLLSFGADSDLRTVSEALRDLRTNIVFADDNLGSILVTSPEGRHGKTTIAAGLSTTMARLGARAILVDADLHRGRVAEILRVPQTPGLREILEGGDPAGIVRSTPVANLDLLTSGRIGGDAGELLATGFRPLVAWLEDEYDVVVIDAPPLVPVNDARMIAGRVKTTLLVCAAGKASHRSVREAVERLKLIGVTPTAGVLNMSRSRQARGYYGPAAKTSEPAVADGQQTDAQERVEPTAGHPTARGRTPSP